MKERAEIEPRLGDEIPEDLLRQARKEINSKYRTFTLDQFRDKKDTEIRIYQPTSGVDSIAQDAYTKVYNRLLKDPDLMTRRQVEKLINEKGIWGDSQQKQIENLTNDMRDIELNVAQMRKKGNFNKATMNRFRNEWKNKRTQVNDLIREKTNILSNSVEGRAEEEEIRVKLSLCVKYPDESLVWSSLEELNNETDRFALAKIVNEAMLFWSGLTQEIIDELPVKLLFDREAESEKLQEA